MRPGIAAPGKAKHFDLTRESAETGRPVFRGEFAHGPPAGRFLDLSFYYLSWKREGEHANPWGWRIKILSRESLAILGVSESGAC